MAQGTTGQGPGFGSLTGRVALVTGGGIRLGRALAEALGKAGAHVAVHAHASRAGADDAVATIRAAGADAAPFLQDLTEPDGPARLAAAVEARWGRVDILVNSAAGFDRAPFVETSAAVLDRLWSLNTRAPYLLSAAVARGMLARGRGDILNLLDVGGTFIPWKQYSAYCMTKAALGMLTQCLALELAPAVRVNGIAPGTVLPPQSLEPATLETLKRRIPAQRFGSPEDITQSALFLLAGPQFITGQILCVDGGRSRGSAHPDG